MLDQLPFAIFSILACAGILVVALLYPCFIQSGRDSEAEERADMRDREYP